MKYCETRGWTPPADFDDFDDINTWEYWQAAYQAGQVALLPALNELSLKLFHIDGCVESFIDDFETVYADIKGDAKG